MVGMPYPNIKSPELQEKMTYLDQALVSTLEVLGLYGEGFMVPGVSSQAHIWTTQNCPCQGLGERPVTPDTEHPHGVVCNPSYRHGAHIATGFALKPSRVHFSKH